MSSVDRHARADAAGDMAGAVVPPDAVTDPAAEESRVGRNVGALAGAQLITWTMTLAWTVVVPRSLGPDGMGIIMGAWAAVGILGIVLGLGTRNYLAREFVVDRDGAPRLLGTAIVLRVALSPLLFGAAIVYGQLAGYGREATLVLYLAAAATIFVQLAEPLQAAFQAIERMKYIAYSEIINKSAQGLVGIALVLLGFGTVGITGSWAVMAALVVVLNVLWLRGHLRIDFRTNLARVVDVVKKSFPYWAFGVFFLIYLWIDMVMLSLMTRPEVVGWYAVPVRLFQTMMFLPVVISTAWLPPMVRAYEQGPEELRRVARAPVELVLLLGLPIAAGTAIAADPVIGVLYGSAYENAVPVLVILGLCIPLMYTNIILAQVLVAANRQTSWTWAMLAATIVNPLFNFVLIRVTESRYDNGAIGAATSLLLTEVVIVTIGFVMIGRAILDGGTIRRCALGIGAAVAMWAVAYAARGLGPVLAFAAGALTFVVLAGALRIVTADELALMRAGISRVLQRLPSLRRRAATAS